MRHQNTLDLAVATLVIIDMQEAFRATMPDFTETAKRIATMTRAALLLGLPIIVTEQYPRGLGHTAEEIKAVLPGSIEVIEKTAFSSCGAGAFTERLNGNNTRMVLVCGIEAHICVNQTTHDLLAQGFQVHLLIDCVSSRTTQNKEIGIAKMLQSGAIPSSVELAVFELMRDAKHERFKDVQAIVTGRKTEDRREEVERQNTEGRIQNSELRN
jgi:nicotinamidase-related amidase